MGIYMGKIQNIGLMMLLLLSVACNGIQNQLNQEIQEKLDSSSKNQGENNSILISCMIESQDEASVENDAFVECYQTSDISTAANLITSCNRAEGTLQRNLSCEERHGEKFSLGKCRLDNVEAFYHYEGVNMGKFKESKAEKRGQCYIRSGVWSE